MHKAMLTSTLLLLGLSGATPAMQDERLWLGFEKEEMARIAETVWRGNKEAKPPFVVPADPNAKRSNRDAHEFC